VIILEKMKTITKTIVDKTGKYKFDVTVQITEEALEQISVIDKKFIEKCTSPKIKVFDTETEIIKARNQFIEGIEAREEKVYPPPVEKEPVRIKTMEDSKKTFNFENAINITINPKPLKTKADPWYLYEWDDMWVYWGSWNNYFAYNRGRGPSAATRCHLGDPDLYLWGSPIADPYWRFIMSSTRGKCKGDSVYDAISSARYDYKIGVYGYRAVNKYDLILYIQG
jgi:hypothetical protein